MKIASKLLLLTFVRKSELTNATWSEIDIEKQQWTIPAARMKKRAAHLVPLSDQAIDLLVALKTMAGASEYILPGLYDASKPIANSTLNRFLFIAAEEATKHGTPVDRFGPHDLRRTASTISAREKLRFGLDREAAYPRTERRSRALQQGRVSGTAPADDAGLGRRDR